MCIINVLGCAEILTIKITAISRTGKFQFESEIMFKLCCVAPVPTGKLYWMELPFTHKNGDFSNKTKLLSAYLESVIFFWKQQT